MISWGLETVVHRPVQISHRPCTGLRITLPARYEVKVQVVRSLTKGNGVHAITAR